MDLNIYILIKKKGLLFKCYYSSIIFILTLFLFRLFRVQKDMEDSIECNSFNCL